MGPCLELESAFLQTPEHSCSLQFKKPWAVKKRNKFESVQVRWRNLEPVIQSEVSQKEKNKYHILTHLYEILKNGTDKPICRTGIEMQT